MNRLRTALLASLLVLGLAVYLIARWGSNSTPAESPPANPASSAQQERSGHSAPSILRQKPDTTNAETQTSDVAPAEDEAAPPPADEIPDDEAVEALLLELHKLAMQEDADSMERIVAQLDHPSAEVRVTAVIALEQFADPTAIPHLEAAATKSQDPEFKARIAEAIDFLKLPALRDLLDKDGNLIADPEEVPQQDD